MAKEKIMISYNSSEKFHILIDQFDLSADVLKKLYSCCNSTYELIKSINSGNDLVRKILGERFNDIYYNFNRTYIDGVIDKLNKNNIQVVTIDSEDYPDSLKMIDCPPRVLYCKGNVKLLSTECISIVGMRKCSEKYMQITKEFASTLSRYGYTVVSGMAEGVDKYAHQSALKLKNPTIAVLAGGFEHIYPSYHLDLFNKIVDTGLVVCEYRPSQKAQRYKFIHRNRIVAGLSAGTLITCAGEKSGTFTTANFAVDFSRELFVIPGGIDELESKGTNSLIKDLQGSAVVTPIDIINILGKSIKEVQDKRFEATNGQRTDSNLEHLRQISYPMDSVADIQMELKIDSNEKLRDDCNNAKMDSSVKLDKRESNHKIDKIGESNTKAENLDEQEAKIIFSLRNGKKHFSDLLDEHSTTQNSLIAQLSMLEIKGYIRRLTNNYYELTKIEKSTKN